MFFFYQIIFSLIILFSPLIIFYRLLKKKESKKSIAEKFCLINQERGKGKLIWFHGSSVGELMSVMPLIHHYEKNKTIDRILVTSNTLSSSKIIKKLKLKKTIHQFFPIDQYFIVKKFLNNWKPSIAIFIDSEIWPSMFNEINKRNISLLLLNARITKKSFKRWMQFENFSKEVYSNITKAYPQNVETKYYLKELIVKKIKFIGNLKFIENKLYNQNLDNLNSRFKNYKTWVAASTHSGEEYFCAKTHIKLKKKIKKLITIIIPRHINRVNEIISELKKLNLNILLHSANKNNLNNIDIYLVDSFGESKNFYKIASSVFLGKSITVRGGQNPLEPIHQGAQILHGPHVDNFRDVYKFLKSLNASKEIKNINQLTSQISFKKNKKIGNKIKKIGAIISKQTLNEINKFL